MADINALLSQRTQKSEQSSKMTAMAKQSADGNLTSFSGVFSVTDLSEKEKIAIEEILTNYAEENNSNIRNDLETLLSITSEVKAINNQAALLHGERIKKAHGLLIRYRDGAFTAWLMAAYGNRQTPYNLMQYYEFYESTPKPLRQQLESMPKQAAYTLAGRKGSLDQKQEIIKNYQGESKIHMLGLIRTQFPLDTGDKRQQKIEDSLTQALEKIAEQLKTIPSFDPLRKNKLMGLLQEMHRFLEGCKD